MTIVSLLRVGHDRKLVVECLTSCEWCLLWVRVEWSVNITGARW